MDVVDVVNAIAIIIVIEVILDAVTVKVTRPFELVNSCIVIIIFVVTTWSRAIWIFICHSIVIVIHRILVCEIECANRLSGPRVDNGRVKATVCAHIKWVKAECFECSYIDWPFKNTVIVVIPILCIKDSIIVVVKWVGAIASIESL